MDQRVTVLGAGGWIGTALVEALKHQGRRVQAVKRDGLAGWLDSNEPPGTVIDTIGLTADFRQRPHATVEAHVEILSRIVKRPGLFNLLFLSSTRVYSRSSETREDTPLPCLSSDPSDLYNLSKLLGEALVLQDSRKGLKVVRLSNVVGPDQPQSTFVGALLEEARLSNTVTIRQSPDTSKDYVHLADVVRLLPLIAEQGQQRIYNLGSGRNTSHAQVAAWLERQGVDVQFAAQTTAGFRFPTLKIARLADEFVSPQEPFGQNSLNLSLLP